MSDERDELDGTAGDAGPDAGSDAVAESARPTGKASRRARSGGTATVDVTKPKAVRPAKKKARSGSRNPFVFIWTYLRQVVSELRKVIWPNRKQMVTYTTTVVVFVTFMVALISGLDLGFARGVLWLFG